MRRPWAYGAAAAWVALLFALSSAPLGDGALHFPWRFAHDDKAVHAGLYAVLGTLVRLAAGRAAPAVGAGLAVGIVDEAIQSRVPGRHADPWDVVADVLGAALGAAAIALATRRRARGAR